MKISWVLFVAILLSGCSLVPDYQRPDMVTPQNWRNAEVAGESAIEPDWWKNFGSADLDTLMREALAQNNDLRAAMQRVAQARASLRIAGASLLPSADASAGYSRTRNEPARGEGDTSDSLRGGIGVSYELDLFGANAAGVEAASAQYAGTRFDRDALALVVMGDVARGYFTLLNLRERVALAENNLGIAREILRVVQARFDNGASSQLELSQQLSSVASSEASIASLRQQAIAAENALAVLIGQAPQNFAVAGDTLQNMAIPVIAPGQPSTLLERRPDIRGAEAGLVAANADIGAARAAFFPVINLGADLSIAANPASDPMSRALALTSSLTAPIFSAGRLEGGLAQSKARQAELVENYRKTVLVSFQEVEDALAAARAAEQRRAAFEQAYREAQTSYDLSHELYLAGSIDFQTLLNTQGTLFNAQDGYASAKLEMLNAAVDVYKALGGGWAS